MKEENMDINYISIANNIVKYRTERKHSQVELAKILGIASTTLSDVECGRKKPSINLLIKIANALKINIDYLFEGNLKNIKNFDGISLDDEAHIEFCKNLNFATTLQKEEMLEIMNNYIEIKNTNK